MSDKDNDSDTESFKSAQTDHDLHQTHSRAPHKAQPSPPQPEAPTAAADDDDAAAATPHFTPEEEAALVTESNTQKTLANAFFARADYSSAIQTYEKSLAALPGYLDFELAVLKANIAACHLKLAEWKLAVESATAAVEALERLDPSLVGDGAAARQKQQTGTTAGVEEPAVQEVDDETARRIERLARSGRPREEVLRIRVKALLRRAKGREELGGWADLAGAEEDYKHLAGMTVLSPLDRKAVDRALKALPPRLEAAKQKEMAEMMGKLKDLGNGILKPFGLSTDNFQFVKDEKTGGYSMNFNQGAGKQ